MQTIKLYFSIFILFIISTASVFGQYTLPEYSSFTLDNGLKVYLMERHAVPVISVSVIIPAGAIDDEPAKAGLADLTATALKHGTKNYTKSKLDETVDFLGSYINTGASKEYSYVESKFAAKDQDEILNILKEVLIDPVFDAEEFEKEKNRLLVNLDQQKESPRSVIGAYFNKLIYSDHVYGNITNGTKNTVSSLTVNDVKEFHKNNYLPNNAAISIVGDFSSKEMKKKISKLFKEWKKGSTKTTNKASEQFEIPNNSRILLVNKDDAKETTFIIGQKGISRNNPDYIAIDVINTLFGGRFTSMLNDELRVNSGLTYGAGSRFSTLKNSGTFYISTFTAKETTEAAIDKAIEVLNTLHEKGIDEKNLTSGKNYVKGQFPPDYETTSQLASLLTQMFWYNFDESFINNFEKNVDNLDVKKANEIIAKYFPKDNLQFVLVGKADEIKSIAEKYGIVKQVEIKEDIQSPF
ncbi:MAG: pitrilysin family protein [Flavobacteriaceae bacterium]|jgi:predicted Zn-dependent peptidase